MAESTKEDKMSAQDDGDSGFDPFFDGDDEDEGYCPECDSELDPETGLCPNELCEYHDPAPEGGPSDVELRQAERRQMGLGL